MEDEIRKALARRRELISELRELDRFLKTSEQFGSTVTDSQAAEASLEAVRGSWRQAPRPSDLVEATLRILRLEGRPLSRGILFQRLTNAGTQMPGKDPVRNFGTIIWRSGRFDKLEGGYWPKEEQRPDTPK